MVEYGNGIGQVAGQAGGGRGPGGTMDVGAAVVAFVNDSAHTISTTPPTMLLAAAIVILVLLVLLRRAF
jgi:hypothetical protein